MERAIGIGQLRANTRAYLEIAASGETLLIVRRGRPVARIEALLQDSPGDDSCLLPSEDHGVLSVDIAHFRSQASRYLDQVIGHSVVHVLCRGRPLAQIQPFTDETLVGEP